MSNNTAFPPNNGALLTIAKITKGVMASAEVAELGASFIHCKEAIPARQSLEDMGHIQPPTAIQTFNATTHGVVTNKIVRKILKSMDIRLHWICCRVTKGGF